MNRPHLRNLEKLAELHRPRAQEGDEIIPAPTWPRPLAAEAFHGLTGEIVKAIIPHTESDEAALLIQFLVVFGNIIGRKAHFPIEADRHYLNLFVVLVGKSSKARKGTSWGHVTRIFETIDPDWKKDRVKSGLSSGEGLIWAVRDPVQKQEANKESPGEFKTTVVDPGIADKRLCDIETEFASVLKNFERDGNKLSAVLRDAWDRGELGTLTKNESTRATNAHISIIGHITKDELLKSLTQTEAANGFGNRFLWLCVKRSKLLAEGGRIQEVNFEPLLIRLRQAVDFGRRARAVTFDPASRDMWKTLYIDLANEKPGILGSITARAEPQILRLASIYALLDCSDRVSVDHLSAAVAIWDYCEESCQSIFGDTTGCLNADRILRALRERVAGLTQTEIIEDIFNRNKRSSEIVKALGLLQSNGLIRFEMEQGEQGRQRQRWLAVGADEPTRHEFNEVRDCQSSDPDLSGSLNSSNSYLVQEGGLQ